MAQDAPEPAEVELEQVQIQLNNRAVDALGATPPDTKKAVELLQAALEVGPKGDLLYLTLARAYQMNGQCELANQTLGELAGASRVKGLPEGFVTQKERAFREDFKKTCPGTLRVVCTPEDLSLVVAGEPLACHTDRALNPGRYQVLATHPSGSRVSVAVDIVGLQTTAPHIKLSPIKPNKLTPPDKTTPPAADTWTRSSRVVLSPGLVAGLCPVQLSNAAFPEAGQLVTSTDTDANLCGGPALDAQAIFSLYPVLGLGLNSSASFMLGSPVRGIKEPIKIQGADARLGAGIWLLDVVELEGALQLHRRALQRGGEDFDQVTALLFGPGLRADTRRILPGAPRLQLSAGFGAGAATQRGGHISGSIDLARRLRVGLTYQAWRGEHPMEGIDYRVEQLTLGVGWNVVDTAR